MADSTPKSYHTDPTLYLYTSLTSGSSHIISATSRMQTILKANKIEFQALDVATDEKARMLWGRRAGKRKLPGLVRFGMIVGDLEEVEEWNEYGELKENVNLPGPTKVAAATPTPSATNTPSKAPIPQAPPPPPHPATVDKAPNTATASTTINAPSDPTSTSKATSTTPSAAAQEAPALTSAASTLSMAMRQAGFEAAKKAGDAKTKARQEELERLRAKSADPPKLEGSQPSAMPPSSGTTDAEDVKKPESGVHAVAGGTDKVPLTKYKEKEEATADTNTTKYKTVDKDAGQLEKAANEEMAKASNEVLTGAAEPEVLEGKGQIEPEGTMTKTEPTSISILKQPEESAKKAEPQQILNAKEAEVEANKAIIADESTHVHIAGSPPPYASPGVKPPREESQESAPPSAALKNMVETDSKLTKKEGDAGKTDSVETSINDKSEDGTKTEAAAPTKPKDKLEDVTKANTDQNKTGAEIKEPMARDGKDIDGKAKFRATENLDTKDTSKEMEKAPSLLDTSKNDNNKPEQATGDAKSTQTEQPAAIDEQPELPWTTTQEQSAPSGEKAGGNAAD